MGTLALSTERQCPNFKKLKGDGLHQHSAERFGRLFLPQSELDL